MGNIHGHMWFSADMGSVHEHLQAATAIDNAHYIVIWHLLLLCIVNIDIFSLMLTKVVCMNISILLLACEVYSEHMCFDADLF